MNGLCLRSTGRNLETCLDAQTTSLRHGFTTRFEEQQQHQPLDRAESSTTKTTMTPTSCPFLDLPTEIRLLIYSFALIDSTAITISSAALCGSYPDIVHRLYGAKRSPLYGLPEHHEPVIEPRYDASLLSVAKPAIIPLSGPAPDPPAYCNSEEKDNGTTALLLVNRQVHAELTSHFKLTRNRNTSLFISFPHGLHVFRTLCPHLLRQAKSVHIAGSYRAKDFCNRRAACMPAVVPPKDVKYNGNFTPDSTAQLTHLVTTVLGPNPSQPLQKFELRMYYPGEDAYASVWGDDSSPIVIALRNIYGGQIDVEVWRGRYGTGVYLTARPSVDGRRVVSTVWRRLEEGRRGEPEKGSWAVDAKWPAWEQEYVVSGPKDVIIT